MIPTVLIVKEGQWGQAQASDYEPQIRHLKEALEEEVEVPGGHGRKEPAAHVEICDTAKEAEQRLKTGTTVHSVVFISRDMAGKAEELAARYPQTRFVVWTGLIPDGKIVWVNKTWGLSSNDLRNYVLH